MSKELHILMLEDRPTDAELITHELRRQGFQFVAKRVMTEVDFLDQLRSFEPDLVLADYALPSYDGLSALASLRRILPELPFIFVSGTLGEETAIEALQNGATDYVLKQRMTRLGPAVRRALAEAQQRRERQRTEEALRESEERFRGLYENAVVGFYRTTPDGRILLANPAVLSMLGYASIAELSQRNLEQEGFAPDYPRAAFKARLEREGQVRGWESAWKRRDGGIVFVSENCRAIRGPAGQTLYYDGSVEDITARKQLQAQFLQAQKMEAIGQLAGGVAHDFNNILAALLLELGLLLEEDLAPEILASLREVQQGTQRAASLTRQLLLFSRRHVLQSQRVDLNQVIQELIKMLGRVLGEHIDLAFTPSSEPLLVEADPGMVEQVVMNLCVNARDAMPRGGRLSLGAQRIRLEAQDRPRHPSARAGHFACLLVTDTGCGMDEATLKRIFEPFFTTKDAGKGTGLGLATVQGIMELHHGWVEVASISGRGTTFQLFLPAVEGQVGDELETSQPKVCGGTETILLVEDDKQVRKMAKSALCLFGYEVLEASNGVEAIRIWEREGARVNLLFTDIVMPEGLTGLDLAQRLRQSRPSLKVIISSGYSAELLQQNGERLGAVRFLPKPYDPPTLARAVRACLDEGGASDRSAPQ